MTNQDLFAGVGLTTTRSIDGFTLLDAGANSESAIGE
jgi:hypothetical protein